MLADDDPRWKRDPVEQASAACHGGAAVVQLRAKLAGDRERLGWARRIRTLTREAGVLFVVDDRFDLALAAGADGVHLGQEDLPPGSLPAAARRRLLVGRSTHDLEQVRRAVAEGVDYLGFGPIFATTSKRGADAPRGPAALEAAVAAAAPLPVVAIGGIGPGNLEQVAARGAGAAVISAAAGADAPEAAVRELCARLGGARR